VDAFVGVERGDPGEQFFLGGGSGQFEGLGKDAELFAGLLFFADIGVGGGVVADEDDGQAGADVSGA